MIKQIHLNECHSTQDVLKEQLKEASSDDFLVSCENQTSGRGRGENSWTSMPGSLCFSMNIKPHKILSLTAMEIAVLIAEFFELKNIFLKVKWPNDLWTPQNKKCGGILVQGHQSEFLAGVGINLFTSIEAFGGIFEQNFRIDKKQEALEICKFIHANRITDPNALKIRWLKKCGHISQEVIIQDGQSVVRGIFLGLGEYGEAIIQEKASIKNVFNGSLRIVDVN